MVRQHSGGAGLGPGHIPRLAKWNQRRFGSGNVQDCRRLVLTQTRRYYIHKTLKDKRQSACAGHSPSFLVSFCVHSHHIIHKLVLNTQTHFQSHIGNLGDHSRGSSMVKWYQTAAKGVAIFWHHRKFLPAPPGCHGSRFVATLSS